MVPMDPDLGLDLLLMVLWVHTVQCMDPLHILWTGNNNNQITTKINLNLRFRRPMPMLQPDYKIFEMNKRLLQRTEDSDNLWWDAFANEFFDDEAQLTLTFCLEDGPKRYSKCKRSQLFPLIYSISVAAVGRTLIPRFFRSIFEGGVTDLHWELRHTKESFHQAVVSLDCDQATMVTQHGKPMFTKVEYNRIFFVVWVFIFFSS